MIIPSEIELVALDRLVPYAMNARTHSDEQINQLAESMRQFGWTNPVLINADSGIIAGHGRVLAGCHIGIAEVPCIRLGHLTPDQERALILADNKLALNAGWDEGLLFSELKALADAEFDLGPIGFNQDEIAAIFNVGDDAASANAKGSLSDEFLIAPFSVLNAREGWWQDRKRAWLALDIQSELGRGENSLNMSAQMAGLSDQTAIDALHSKRRSPDGKGLARTFGQDLMRGEHVVGETKPGLTWVGGDRDPNDLDETSRKNLAAASSGTSIFDPVLCELAYAWFSLPKGHILDPFAGGSVRGIVAARLGRAYTGIDLRHEQVAANEAQWAKIGGNGSATWHIGDSRDLLSARDDDGPIPDGFDFIFSCPPYGDLEVYSDDPQDLSTMADDEFLNAYRSIIARAVARLKDDRFACFVVGDYRDAKGFYRDFVSRTIRAFEDGGARLYNEAILVTAAGSLAIRAGKQFRTTRKLGKTHQNILVFCKGDPKKATKACGPVDVAAALASIEPSE